MFISLASILFLLVIIPSTNSGKVLVFPHEGSHWVNMRVIVEELHSRGHKVTVIRPADSWYISESSPFYNTVTVDVSGGGNEDFYRAFVSEVIKIKRSKGSAWATFALDMELKDKFFELHRTICEVVTYMFENKVLMKSFHDTKYDAVLTEPVNGGGVMLAHYLGLPLIFTARWTVHGEAHFAIAPSPLSYVPLPPSELTDKMTFFERVKNLIFYTMRMHLYKQTVGPHYSPLSTRYFGPDVDYFSLFQAADLWLMRVDFVFEYPRPTMPNVIYIGGFQCKPAKPLPQHLEEFVQSSGEHGVIIMSLGTLIGELPHDLADEIAAAFAKLPQKVIWRYKGNRPATLGNNTLLVDWMPQNDLLGHPKIKLFVAHGGTNGIYEAIYHGIPIVGIPIVFDQADNLSRLKAKGVAKVLDVSELDRNIFQNTIQEVLNEPSYRMNMQRLSRLHRDQPMKPLDSALFWIEFVMRHKGAAHLRTESYRLPWYSYHSVDVILFLSTVALLVLFTFAFNDLSGSVSLAWVGDGTGVILALTTFQVPFFMIRLGQSKLYRSENYGKSFQDVTSLINNTFIRSEFGIAIGPENSGKVILTGEVSGTLGSRIFVSKDFGKSFTHLDLPFIPMMQITYNPENSNALLVLSNTNELWVSDDFGSNWKKIHDMVCLVKWGRKNTIFFTANLNGSCTDRGILELRRTTDYGKTIKTVGSKIYSFGLGGRFLFASVMTGKGTLRIIHVSVDQGESWNMAQLPPVGHEQFYSILAANDEMVFMHVDEPGDTGFGTIYVSDDRGTVYSKSLERHLYTTTGGDTDFTNVTSLRGVFITSVLAEDSSVQSVVSFDQGGEWVPLHKPANTKCDATAKDPDKCSLHIHAAYSTAMRLNVPMLPLSEPNAVGLILAHGSVGDAISVMRPDVYVSDDGGYTWIKALDGPHHYAILDSGGLLVAVEHSPTQPINKIRFSTDEGQCWGTYTFTEEPIYFTGLASEPGARSMNVSIWGYRDSLLSQYWVSITIDFRDLLTRDCEDKDYVQWLAHSDDISDPNDGCMLGYKERFLRMRKDSVCWNGRDYEVNTQPTPCPCTLDDFLCDFGYYRKENSSECIEQPDLKGKVLEFCLHGKEEQLQTSGYRKIPGDKCEGGRMPERKEIDLSKRCVSDLLGPELLIDSRTSKSVPIVITVIVIMLLSVAAGVVFVKKYVCGGRFLVHRYSVLQQHVEDNTVEGMDDPLETNHEAANGKIEFYDDSDEDLLE